MRSLAITAVLLGSACTATEPTRRAPVAATAPPPVVAATAPPPAVAAPRTSMMGAKPNEPITLRGRVATIVGQHLVGHVAGKREAYFDVGRGVGEGGEQTIVYWIRPPACPGDVVVTGSVIEVRGAPKRPLPPAKVDDSYAELHVDVTSARCAE